jgi:hypothetical protein
MSEVFESGVITQVARRRRFARVDKLAVVSETPPSWHVDQLCCTSPERGKSKMVV